MAFPHSSRIAAPLEPGAQSVETFRLSGWFSKVPPFFVKDYANAARFYPPAKLKEIQHLLREADLNSKGVGNASAEDGELLRELLARVMN